MSSLTYKKENVENMLTLLKKHVGSKKIITPNKNRNASYEYKISKDALAEKLNDKAFLKLGKEDDSYITLDEFIDYVHKQNNSRFTMGIYHNYMPFMHLLYNVQYDEDITPIDDKTLYSRETSRKKIISMPCYNLLKPEERDKVSPKRPEFLFISWINKNIEIHPFLRKHLELLKITYQEPVKEKDGRYYDLTFRNINMVIEVQEYTGKNHNENPNDKLKEAMAIMRGYKIYFFQLRGYDMNTYDYLEDTWFGSGEDIGIETMLIRGLLAFDYKNEHGVITDYLLYQMNNHNLKLVNSLTKDLKTLCSNIKKIDEDLESLRENKSIKKQIKSKIKEVLEQKSKDYISEKNEITTKLTNVEKLSDSFNVDNINILFRWYQQSFGNCDKFIIDPSEKSFRIIFRNSYNNLTEIIKLCKTGRFCGEKNKTSNEPFIDEYFGIEELIEKLKDNEISNDYKNIRFSWNGLVNLFLRPNNTLNSDIISLIVSNDNKIIYANWMLDLLLRIESTYTEIIEQCGEHNKIELNERDNMYDVLYEHKIKDMKNEYIKENKKISEQCSILENENKIYNDRTNNIIGKVNTLKKRIIEAKEKLDKQVKKYKSKINLNIKPVIEQLESIEPDIEIINKYRINKNHNKYTMNILEKNKSIIKENQEFGIIFTGDLDDKISSTNFFSYLKTKNIPITFGSNLVKELSVNNSKIIPKNIFKLKLVDKEFIETLKKSSINMPEIKNSKMKTDDSYENDELKELREKFPELFDDDKNNHGNIIKLEDDKNFKKINKSTSKKIHKITNSKIKNMSSDEDSNNETSEDDSSSYTTNSESDSDSDSDSEIDILAYTK